MIRVYPGTRYLIQIKFILCRLISFWELLKKVFIFFFFLISYASELPVASDPRVIRVQRNNRYRVCLEVPGICYRSVGRPSSMALSKARPNLRDSLSAVASITAAEQLSLYG